MEQERSDLDLFQILDDNIKRSNKLGNFECPDIIDLPYWDIRYNLPEKIMKGMDELCSHFVKNISNFTDGEKISFYFWIKDELQAIAEMERNVLTPRRKSIKSNYKPSPRTREYYYLIELNQLSGGCPIKAEKIKKMKYSIIFETLLANVINSEGEWMQ